MTTSNKVITFNVAAAVSAGDLTTFAVEQGSGSEFVTFGHTFPQGAVPSGANVVITNTSNVVVATAQTDKRASWPDGSLSHAILHGNLTTGTSYKIRTGTPPTGTNKDVTALLAAISDTDIARVDITIGGLTQTATLRDLLSSVTNRAPGGAPLILEQGPTMLGVVVARDLHTHIRTSFHVRWYGGSVVWVEVLLENGYGTIAGQGDKAISSCVVTLLSVQKFSGSGTLWNHTSWARDWWATGGTLYAHLNTRYLCDSGAWLNFNTSTNSQPLANTLTNLSSTQPAIGASGGYVIQDINQTGDSPQIAPMPLAEAYYFATSGDVRTFNYMKAYHRGGAVYPRVALNASTGEQMIVPDFPTFRRRPYNDSVNAPWTGFASGSNSTSNPWVITGNANAYEQSSHDFFIGYSPYLLTGQYGYMRMMVANGAEHAMFPSSGSNFTFNDGAGNLTYRLPSDIQLRNVAWCQRTWAGTGFALPDSHVQKRYFRGQFLATCESLYQRYISPGSDPWFNNLGCMPDGDWRGETFITTSYARFEHDFMVAAMGWAVLDLGYNTAHTLAFAQYVGKFTAGLLGNTGEFPFEFATGPGGRIDIGPQHVSIVADFSALAARPPNPSSNSLSVDSGTLAKAAAMHAADTEGNSSSARNEMFKQNGAAHFNEPAGYYANMLPGASMLERLGVPGGYDCWYRTRLSGLTPDFRDYNVWDILPRAITLPAWVSALPLKQWKKLPNSACTLSGGATITGTIAARTQAWTGAALMTYQSDYYFVANGGHSDSSENAVFRFRLNQATPSWVLARACSTTQQQGATLYSDGRPVSNHTGYRNVAIDGHNKIVMFGGYAGFGGVSGGANPVTNAKLSVFDPVLGDYRTTSLNSGPYADLAAMNDNTTQYPAVCINRANGYAYWNQDTSTSRSLNRWRPAGAGLNTSIGNSGGQYLSIYIGAACDPKTGLILMTPDGFGNSGWMTYSIEGGGGMTNRTVSGLPANSSASTASIEWDPDGDSYIYYNPGVNRTQIYSIARGTYASAQLGLTADPVNGSPPTPSGAGIFSRGKYVPELKGFVVCVNYDDAVWFVRLH